VIVSIFLIYTTKVDQLKVAIVTGFVSIVI
jgi:hypothetical protein